MAPQSNSWTEVRESKRQAHKNNQRQLLLPSNVLSSGADCGLSVSYRPGAKHTKTSLIPWCQERIKALYLFQSHLSQTAYSQRMIPQMQNPKYEQKKVTLRGWLMGLFIQTRSMCSSVISILGETEEHDHWNPLAWEQDESVSYFIWTGRYR